MEVYQLSPRYKIFRRIVVFDTIESTQDFALKNGKRGDIIVARVQTKGRGRFKRKWYSPLGGLWFSFVVESSGIDSVEACLAVLNVLKKYIKENIGIKYPNDIFVDNKKICGIIAEIKGKDSVVGIGINVNNELPEFLNATSLKKETNKEHDILVLLLEVLREYEAIRSLEKKKKVEDFRNNQIILGKKVKINLIKEEIVGTAVNIDDDFNLIVISDGEVVKINAGDVFLIE